MKKNGFIPIIILIIAILGTVGYFAYKSYLIKPNRLSPQEDAQNEFKSYENNTYGIKFQYSPGSIISYERKDINNKLDETGPIVSLVDNSLEMDVNGRKMKDDVGYFSLGIILKDKIDLAKDSIYNNCGENASKETEVIVNKYGTKLWVSNYTGQYEQRIACTIHGKYVWTFSTHFVYPNNKDRISKLFDVILNSFKFTK